MSFFVKTGTDRYGDTTYTPRIARIVLSAIALVLVCIFIFGSFTSIPTGHTGVVTTFGKVENYTLDSGFHLVGFWHKIIKMDNRVQKESVTLSCFSSDIQEVSMKYTLNYQISKADAMTIYSTIGTKYFDTVIVPNITEAIKSATAHYTAEELIDHRSELAQAIEDDLVTRLDDYFVEVVATNIEDIDFTDVFTDAVEAKQVAQQNKLRAATEAEQKVIETKAAADAQVIAAQAEADAMLIEAQAQSEANELLRQSLTDEVLQKMYYEKWNGVLPQTMLGSDAGIIMNMK